MQIVLTGANRGIGAELTAQLRARGDDVTATSRDGSTGTALDVTDRAALDTLAASDTAPIDLLICNAGVYLDKGHSLGAGYDTQLWADTFAVNVAGVFETVQAFLPRVAASAAPRIAVIASQMGSSERAGGNGFIYRASKAAAVNLARNLAIDLAPRGVAVGAYHPGASAWKWQRAMMSLSSSLRCRAKPMSLWAGSARHHRFMTRANMMRWSALARM